MNEPMNLHEYADGRLSAAERARVEEAVANDPGLRRELEAIQALKATLIRHCGPVADDRAWDATLSRLDELDRVKRAENFVGRHAWGLCGAFLVLIVGAAVWNRQATPNTLYTADMARVSASMVPVSPPLAGARDAWGGWIRNHLGRAPIEFNARPVRVLGAQKGEWDGRRAVRLDLEDGVGPMILFMVGGVQKVHSGDGSTQGRYCLTQMQGVNAVSWVSGDYAFLLAGNRGFNDLVIAAEKICAEK